MKAFFELALQRDEFRDDLMAILREDVCGT
jgi:hypothetical protein